MWLVYALIGVFGLFVLMVVWGIVRLRRGFRQASTEICSIELSEIEGLTRECTEVFSQKLGTSLDIGDWENAAKALDDAFKNKSKLELAFSRPEFRWYFVKPVGAFFGELLRRHANHEWQTEENAAPSMVRMLDDGSFQAFPFEKILKQYTTGDHGDLLAFVMFARTADLAAAQLPPS